MLVRVAINGFGRIGRNAFKVALEDHPDEIEIVAINDLTEPKVLAHLLEYDTAYGHWDRQVDSDDHNLIIDGKKYPVLSTQEPSELPWRDLNVDVVIESTGRFTDEEGMSKHLAAGAGKVILSAPAKDGAIGTFLMGVNHDKYQGQQLINNASCTTNCVAPVAAIILERFGVQKALMTTTHSVTAEQNLVDGPPPGGKANDLRRARAAYANIIPTSTGAAISTTEAVPELKELFDGRAIRIPTIVGSISDFTFLLKRKTTVEEVNQAVKDACETPRWKGIVAWTEDPLVSSDIIGRPESAIVDLSLTQLVDGDLLKVFAWYDNEWGYCNRLIEQVINIARPVLPPQPEFVVSARPATADHGVAERDSPPTPPPLPVSEEPLRPDNFFAQDLQSQPVDQQSSVDGNLPQTTTPQQPTPSGSDTLSPAPSAAPAVQTPPSVPVPSFVTPVSAGQPSSPAVSTDGAALMQFLQTTPQDRSDTANDQAPQKKEEDVQIHDEVVSPTPDVSDQKPKSNPFLSWLK